MRHRFHLLRPLAFALRCTLLALPAVGLSFTFSHDAHAQEAAAQIQVPAGSLSEAINHLAQQLGVAVVMDERKLAELRSDGLHGTYGAKQGFAALLAGSGYEARETPSGYVIVVAENGVVTLSTVRVRDTAVDGTSEGTGSYAAQGSTLFKGTQSLKDIPQSVTVVTRQKMDDLRLDTLDEVLENTPGITLVKRPAGGNDIYSRGFSTNTIQYDGIPLLRESYWGNAFAASSVYLDRVEVLRGAQGLLEGAGDPAGAVNVVRKRGLVDTAFNIEGRAGSWDNYGTRLETGGALDKQTRLRSRVVLDYEDKGSFVDTISDRNLNAYGALDFDMTPDTTLGLGVAHSLLKGNSSLYNGVPRYANGRPLDISRSVYGGAGWNDAERRETQVLLDLEHRFTVDWKLKISGAYIKEDWDSIISYGNGLVPVGGSTRNGLGYDYDFSAKNAGLDISLSGKFEALGISHDVMFGSNYSKQKRDDGYLQYLNYMAYDVSDTNYDAPRFGTTAPTNIVNAKRDTGQKGVYTMLRSHLTDRLTSIVGARTSWYEQESNQINLSSGSYFGNHLKENAEFTPYVGLVYALMPQWAVYASYADIFQPQSATNAQLQVLQPIIGTNYEFGIKGELFDGHLNTSLAMFRIDQENRAITDYDAPMVCNGWYCSRAAGKVRSEGFELEAHGELISGLQISGGYTYNRNELLEDANETLIGKLFDWSMPKHILRLWSDYRLPGQLSQWRVGAGVNYRSEQKTSSTTQLNPAQGGYSVWNARIAYEINNNWSASLNIENLFDKHYYSFISNNYFYNYVGEPRNFMFTLRGSF